MEHDRAQLPMLLSNTKNSCLYGELTLTTCAVSTKISKLFYSVDWHFVVSESIGEVKNYLLFNETLATLLGDKGRLRMRQNIFYM